MSVPAIIYLAICLIGLLISANGHGRPKEGVESFWHTAIGCSITISLLYWGGFFEVTP